MKNKIVALIGFLCLGTLYTHAQNFAIGLKGGFNQVGMRITDGPAGISYTSRPSYSLGLTIHDKLGEKLGIRLEPGYIEKGATYKDAATGKSDLRLHYLNLPFLLSYTPFNHFYVEAGPEFGYLFDANNAAYDQALEISGILGLSYDIHERVNAGMRYSMGLTKIADISQTDAAGNEMASTKQYTQYFEVFVRFYMIRI